MRFVMLALYLLATACGGQTLNSPAAPGIIPSGLAANPGGGMPFTGTFVGTSFSTDFTSTGFRIIGTLEGTASHLGRFTAATVDNVNTATNTSTGAYNFTAANRDQLFTTVVGTEQAFVPPNVSKVTITATIVGGTGRFEGAGGSFTLQSTEVINFAAGTAVRSGSFDGTLSFGR